MPGSVPTLEPADNGIIYMRWTEPSLVKGKRGRSKRLSTGTREMATAKVFLANWLLLEKDGPAAPTTRLTIGELWPAYDAKKVETMATPENARSSWKNLQVAFATLTASDIADDKITQYIADRGVGRIGRPSIPGSVRKELAVLQAMIRWCAHPKRGLVAPGDVQPIDLPAPPEPRDRWLTTEEIRQLLSAAEALREGDRLSKLERFLYLALCTAARKTAISQLTWPRVDRETWVVHYNVPGRRITTKRRADVPISTALRPILLRAYDERVNEHVLDDEVDVWPLVHDAAEKAGLVGVSPHTLRHTAATHMARAGIPLWLIAKILGNSLHQVEKTYAKHCPDDLRPAVDKIPAAAAVLGADLGAKSDPQRPTVGQQDLQLLEEFKPAA